MEQQELVVVGPPPGERKHEQCQREEDAVDGDRNSGKRARVGALRHGVAVEDPAPGANQGLVLELLKRQVRSDAETDHVQRRQHQAGVDAPYPAP